MSSSMVNFIAVVRLAGRRSCHPVYSMTSRWTAIDDHEFGSRVIYERYGRAREELGPTPPSESSATRRLGCTRPDSTRRAGRGAGPVGARERPGAAFADVWCAIPKVVLSRTVLTSTRQRVGSRADVLAEEAAAALDALS